jgi:excisionase family DNA binding protein
MMTATMTERLWTVKQVQEYLQMSRSWVYRELEARRLPHTRIGGVVRFIPEQVRQYAEQRAESDQGHAKIIPLAGHPRNPRKEP